MSRFFEALPEWVAAPEVSFAVYGERGVIDILAWHAATRSLLVIELKTELVDVQELVGTADRKRRLAATVARERGWDAASVSCWLIVADSRTNRRRVDAHRSMLRNAFPADGKTLRSWLARPRGVIAGMSFWSDANPHSASHTRTAPKRIRRRSGLPATI